MIGSVSLVVNYFVSFKAASLDYAFLVGLYLLLIRMILFQMAKLKYTFKNKMQQKNIHVLEKAGMITGQNANQEPIYLSCTKVMVI